MKCALISIGNEESYGLLFVGGELLLFDQDIKYFDAEEENVIEDIISWEPDYIMFSPMTAFFDIAIKITQEVKKKIKVISVFGGHHASSYPQIVDMYCVDKVVVGPVRGSVAQILNGKMGVIRTILTTPDSLSMPARKEYYRDIPRMGQRYRKVMISLFGCPWNCTYCSSSSSHLKEIYGKENHRRYFLSRRPIDVIMKEAKEIISLSETHEIEWVDDDLFSGDGYEEWLGLFISKWKNEIGLPMYVSTASKSVLKASDGLLRQLRSIVNCVGMGVQAIRPGSLRLFNRHWDNEPQMKAAYDRLISFGYRVNLQAIVGLPVDDPVGDAIDTIKCIQRVGPGSICSIYPLMVYPGTKIDKECIKRGLKLNNECNGDTNSGIPNIMFDSVTTNRLRNICKLATMFVKYGVDERWMRTLIDVEFDDEASKNLSMTRYHDCVVDRLKDKGESIFDDIQKSMKIRY
jgi:hypothetical protein